MQHWQIGLMEEARETLLVVEEESPNEERNTSAPDRQIGGWKPCSLIMCTEFCVCVAYYGIGRNLAVYLKTELLEDSVTAAAQASMWQGTCFLTTLIGAYMADSHWGNYLTIAAFMVIYFMGLVVLTLSTSLPLLKHSHFTSYLGLYMVALGVGSIKPCMSAFGADQFDDADTTAKGSFFSFYYLTVTIGALLAGTVVVWIQDNYGWTIGFGLLTILIGLAFTNLVFGSKFYRYRKPVGSPLTRMCQVIVAATRKFNMDLPENESLLCKATEKSEMSVGNEELENTPEFSFLNKASIVSASDFTTAGALNPWRLCATSQVEELKSILRLLPIWATFILFASVSTQESTVFVEQGIFMNTRLGSLNIPPASLTTFDVLTVIVFTPLYDMIIIPITRQFTGKERGLSHLQRAGIGLFFSIIAMVSAAILETKRLEVASEEGLVHKKAAVSMSILWQIPQHVLVGIGEVLNQIGMLAFFYDQAPDSMRSLCLALALLTISLGGYVTSIILTTTDLVFGWIPDNLNQGHLDRFFWLVSGLCLLNLAVFVYLASRFKYKRSS
ncbi:Protein NRT1/ PTR FAMILY 8.5 [Rhynchospora pubera]|uniref:Protein NRT1/ PTR FAMILY 8.5 n=1 Tax=Rhynchospora pubera TaxID=906938 RepID=A0AAV8E4M4_9POAL|nr:Protein NRT1/ PTR FAMILY 8.5 [Rhynchospora pubera]